jgi:carbonic anhydrase
VPLERIFDQGVGDLFVVRVAGNVADVDEIGSAEYARATCTRRSSSCSATRKCGA